MCVTEYGIRFWNHTRVWNQMRPRKKSNTFSLTIHKPLCPWYGHGHWNRHEWVNPKGCYWHAKFKKHGTGYQKALKTECLVSLTSSIWSPGFKRPSLDTAPSGNISWMTVHICTHKTTTCSAPQQKISHKGFIILNIPLLLHPQICKAKRQSTFQVWMLLRTNSLPFPMSWSWQ